MNTILYDPPTPIERARLQLDRIFEYGSDKAKENVLMYLRLMALLNQLGPGEENHKVIVGLMNKVTTGLVIAIMERDDADPTSVV